MLGQLHARLCLQEAEVLVFAQQFATDGNVAEATWPEGGAVIQLQILHEAYPSVAFKCLKHFKGL